MQMEIDGPGLAYGVAERDDGSPWSRSHYSRSGAFTPWSELWFAARQWILGASDGDGHVSQGCPAGNSLPTG